MNKIRVWDLPTRLFHWALAGLVTASIVTVKIGGNALVWHFYCGYAILALAGVSHPVGHVRQRVMRASPI